MAAMAEEDAALGQSSGDMRPGTAAGEMGMGGMGGGGPPKKGTPIQALSNVQVGELLRQETLYLEERMMQSQDKAAAQAFDPAKASAAISVRFNYSISVPYSAPPASLTTSRTEPPPREKKGAAAEGLSGSSDEKKAGGGAASEKGALGSVLPRGALRWPRVLAGASREAGSSPELKDLVRSSPLHKAVSNGDIRALRLLLGAGCDINSQNLYGDTPLHRAVQNARFKTVVELLRHGADVDRPNQKGDTSLHAAAMIGHVALVRALLTAGAVAMSYNMKGMVRAHGHLPRPPQGAGGAHLVPSE